MMKVYFCKSKKYSFWATKMFLKPEMVFQPLANNILLPDFVE